MSRRRKILLLFHSPYRHPRGYDYKEEFADENNMYTENDVYRALKALGYEVSLLGLHDDLTPLFEEIREFKPDLIFNLVEVFRELSHFEKNIAAVLEMINIPYTGATSENLYLCNNKDLHKKILLYHKIKVPRFHTFYRRHRVWHPKRMKLPAIIKPLTEEASRGISQSSIVDNEAAFIERVNFIHRNMDHDAIAEEVIEGREFYVTIVGHKRLTVLPLREFKFGELPEDSRIATYRAKWDDNFRDRWGIKSVYVGKLAEGLQEEIEETCKRAYRALNFRSYARFDVRVTSDRHVYIIEPNANPCIARVDEVAQSADKIGMSYIDLIEKIVRMALQNKV